MEAFGILMCTIGASAKPTSNFVAILPVEIAQMIFRKLDARSLVNVAKVSRKWRNVCRGDCQLRQTARRHLQSEEQFLYDVEPSSIKPSRVQRSNKTNKDMKRSKRTSSRIPPVTFGFRPPGVSSGAFANQANRRNFGSYHLAGPKRSISKLR